MLREVRRVPADWRHPINPKTGRFLPLFDGKHYQRDVTEWNEGAVRIGDVGSTTYTYEDWSNEKPKAQDYMPQWADAERTHLMMYEVTSEGTPISPAFETPEELARWLADTNARVFAGERLSYADWLRIAQGGCVPSLTIAPEHGLQSKPQV